jgi:hypothetical protein
VLTPGGDEPLPVKLVDHGIDWAAWAGVATSVLTAAIVLWTARVALQGLKDAKTTRHGQLVIELSRQWAEPAVVESIRLTPEFDARQLKALVDRLFGPEDEERDDPVHWSKLAVWANLIESMGVLVSEGTITYQLVYKMWGGGILKAWASWEDAVLRLREIDQLPDTFVYFEDLARNMERMTAASRMSTNTRDGAAPGV